MCLISDWGLQRCLDKCAWLCIQKAGKERERLRNGREDRCSDKRGAREKKKRTKKMKTEVLEMLSRKHSLLLLSGLFCWVCICEHIRI